MPREREREREEAKGGACYLCTEAVAQGSQLRNTILLLHRLSRRLDNGVDSIGRVRVVPARALVVPLHEVEAGRLVAHRQRVAVEQVDDEREVAVGGELVRHQLAVLPDADDVRQVEDAGAGAGLLGRRRREVAVPLASDLDVLAGGFTAAGGLAGFGAGDGMFFVGRAGVFAWGALGAGGGVDRTYVNLTPTVQHLPIGLEAIVEGRSKKRLSRSARSLYVPMSGR